MYFLYLSRDTVDHFHMLFQMIHAHHGFRAEVAGEHLPFGVVDLLVPLVSAVSWKATAAHLTHETYPHPRTAVFVK